MKNFMFVTLLLTLILATAIPAGATPPEDVSITMTSQYFFWDFDNPIGSWTADGALSGNGNIDSVLKDFGAGWPHGIGFKTGHIVEVISDDNGTITLMSNSNGFEWTTAYDEDIYGDYCAARSDEYDEFFIGAGNWVILSGTGDHENLHGQGSATVLGCVDWDTLTMDMTKIYDGQMH